MRITYILQKIIELLLLKEGLTVPQIQYQLRTDFGITIPRKLIIKIIDHHRDKLDVIHKCGQSTVKLIPKYRNLISKNKMNNDGIIK